MEIKLYSTKINLYAVRSNRKSQSPCLALLPEVMARNSNLPIYANEMKTELKWSYKIGRMFKRHVYRLATPSLLCRNHPIEDRTESFYGVKMNRSGAPPLLSFSKRLDLSKMHGHLCCCCPL